MSRWAWAEVDLDAVRHNVETISAVVAPAAVWAVVKADGYGHGAAQVAAAARRGGAAGLCVALVKEGLVLRDAGLDCPILVLSEQPPDELADAIRAGLELTVYSHQQLEAIAAAGGDDHPVHLKIDTGMSSCVRSACRSRRVCPTSTSRRTPVNGPSTMCGELHRKRRQRRAPAPMSW